MMARKVVEKRKSVREFSNKAFSAADKAFIKKSLDEMPNLGEAGSVAYEFYEDGAEFIQKAQGLIGYNGVMIEAPHYVVFTAKNGLDNIKTAGFASEWLVLLMAEREIGSCQVSTDGNEEKLAEKLGIQEGFLPVCVLAVGYPKKESFLASIFGTSKQTARQSVEQEQKSQLGDRVSAADFVYVNEFGNKANLMDDNEDIPFMQAFYYMRLAPSVLNRQPWKFVISGDKVVLLIDKGGEEIKGHTAYLEAGIAMFYFGVAMDGEGYHGTWVLDENIDRLGAPDQYIVAGTYVPRV
ncbi:MAG: nitroreductase family protein [Bacillota bacterium]|nr:nitroreductase family protein [Bacillota bacterium]